MDLLIFSPYYPPHIGGLESHSEEFNYWLSQSDKITSITIFTPHLPDTSLREETPNSKIRIIRFPSIEVISNFPIPKFWNKNFWKLWNQIKSNNYNFVISRTRFFYTSIMAGWYANRNHINWIHIEHGSDYVKLSNILTTIIARLYDEIFGRMIFNNSDINISISLAVQRFVNKFDKRLSPIIYRGINMDQIDLIPENSKYKKNFRDKIIIVWAGRLYRWKGVEESIKSIINLPDSIKKNIVFIIIGNGEDYNRLEKISQEPIQLLGQKSREETIGILKIADIYIHSSYPGGGLSTSLIEAMYCKCAIIATPFEGANEIVNKNNGVFILKHANIGKALINLIKNGNMKRYAKEARISIQKKINWSESSNKYIGLLNNIYLKNHEADKN